MTSTESPAGMPSVAWGTKGFDFWILLSLLLQKVRPRAILELGCGRSSSFFADYVQAYDGSYVGIENDIRWARKTELDIRMLGFGARHVRHVPLAADGSWYDLEGFRVATAEPGLFDFAFVDGPNEKQFFANEEEIARYFRPEDGNPFGRRNDTKGLAAIQTATTDCDVMIVDDVHKQHVFMTVDQMLSDPERYDRYYFRYQPHRTVTNALCLCLRRDSGAAEMFSGIVGFLGIDVEGNYSAPDARKSLRSYFFQAWRRRRSKHKL